MIFRRTVAFKREFKNLPLEIQKLAREKFAFFSFNWRHPSLRCRKLNGSHGTSIRFSIFTSLTVIAHDVIVSFSIEPNSIVSKQVPAKFSYAKKIRPSSILEPFQ